MLLKSRRKAAVAIYFLALLVRLAWIFGFHGYQFGRPEPVMIAISLAKTGTFGNPYAIPTGPTAHAPPVYPALIAPIYALLGDTPKADFVRFTFNAAAASGEYALLPYVAEAFGIGAWPGLIAGFGGALVPLHHWPECMGEFETTFTALFIEISALLFARMVRKGKLSDGGACRGGLWCGIGILCSPNALFVVAALVALGIWKLRPRPAAALRWLAVFGAAAVLVLTPWTVRNYVQFHGLFFVRDNAGLELYQSNRDGASPIGRENRDNPFVHSAHPNFGVEAARELLRVGELEFQRQKQRDALAWIRSHPKRFAVLSVERAILFWFLYVPRFRWAFYAATIGAAIGMILLARRHRFAAVTLCSIVVAYSFTYCFVQHNFRYTHPVWWILVLLWGVLVSVVFGRFLPKLDWEGTSPRAGAAA
jgi:hypothetical protein